MNKEELKEYYKDKKVTGGYDKQREGTAYRRQKRKEELRLFLKLLDKKPKEKVLELGCSSGFLTAHLGKVYAIDTSKDMLKITRKKNRRAVVLMADMFKLPFLKSRFDKVVTMRVWNHLPKEELEMVIKEAGRVLKKKGVLVFDIEEKNEGRRIANYFYKRIFKTTGFKIYQYSLDEIHDILEENGFSIERAFDLEHKIGKQIIIRAVKN